MAEEIKFEKAMNSLEKIVEDLENGDIALDDALKKYEEGVKLSRVCQKKLEQSEKKIEMLTRALDGSLKEVPFDPEEGVGDEIKNTGKKKSSAKSVKVEREDEDLLL